jgi:hypothetical protein
MPALSEITEHNAYRIRRSWPGAPSYGRLTRHLIRELAAEGNSAFLLAIRQARLRVLARAAQRNSSEPG